MIPITNDETITLENINDGIAGELFEDGIKDIIENILDPNYPADKVRSLSLIFKFIPQKDRCSCKLSVGMVKKLADANPIDTQILVGKGQAGTEAREITIKQQPMFPEGAEVIRNV